MYISLLFTIIRFLLPLLVGNDNVLESTSNDVTSNDLVSTFIALLTRYDRLRPLLKVTMYLYSLFEVICNKQ
jgi:hypothetical protein